MPIAVAQLSKRDIREQVARRVGDHFPLTTSGAGNGGGTTAVFSALIGKSPDAILNKYLLLTSDDNDAEWRVCVEFAPTTGTITVDRAYTAQVASSVTAELHTYRPDIYTDSISQALSECFPSLYRPVLSHVFPFEHGHTMYGRPRNMRRVMRVLVDSRSSRRQYDFFDRTASATDPGGNWTAISGTWGVSSGERLYNVTDVDAEILQAASNPRVEHGILDVVVRGDTTASNFRVFSLLFRVREDFDGDIDTDNCLLVRLLAGVVDLRRRDGGTESSLTTGTITTTEDVDYRLRVMFQGQWIRIFVDDVEIIAPYELTGLNLKYLQYGHVAVRLDKTGTPTLAAAQTQLDDYRLHELVGTMEVTDWKQSYDDRGVEIGARGTDAWTSTDRVLHFEGIAPLTELASDTTFGTLTTDTTDLVEMESTDPAKDLLYDWAAYVLYQNASQPGNTIDPEDRRLAIEALPAAEKRARATRDKKAQPYPLRALRRP